MSFRNLIAVSFLLCLGSISAYAQIYTPLTKSGLFFDLAEASNTTLCQNDHAERYFFKHDTLIQGITYKKLYYFNFKSIAGPDFCPPYSIDTSLFLSNYFLRDDTASKRVFIYNKAIQTDDLLYDFNLKKGDTLKSEFHKSTNYPVVDSTYLITLLDSSKRKVIRLNSFKFYIEGIGGNEGFLNPLFTKLGSWGKIFCVKDRLSPIYGNECSSKFVSLQFPKNERTLIYPNPTVNQIYINSDYIFSKYLMLDTAGKNVLKGSIDKDQTINVKNIPPGVYIIQLEEAKGSKQVFRIIKI